LRSNSNRNSDRWAPLLQDNETLNRFAAATPAALLDAALFCALFGSGMPLRVSHITSFAAAIALNLLLKARSTGVAAERMRDWRLHCRLLAVSLMALFLRGGVLGFLVQSWGWPAQISIVFAVLAGLAVTIPGYSQALSPAERGARALAIGLVVYALALRLVYLGSVELLPEEAYYWEYSRHLDIGYLDHPPMVAWLIRAGTALFGQSPFGIRIGALCSGIIASVFAYRLTQNLLGEAGARAALVLSQVLPFFFLSGLLMTPDAPLTAAWAASLYYLERALVAGRSDAWWRAGLALGLGAISKYSIALLVPVTLAFMIWDRKSRRWWSRWEPYAAALVALAVFSPVIIWNAQHEWASFAFQTSRRLAEAPRFSLHKLLASALVLITPTGVTAVAAALLGPKPPRDADGGDAPRRQLFVNTAILVPLAVFAAFSLRHEVKLDWTGAPWVAALPVMAAGMIYAGRLSGLRAWIRAAWMPTLVTMLLIYGAGLHYLVLGLPGLGYSRHIELVPVGWHDLSGRILEVAAAVRKETGSDPVIVGMDRYAIASELAFYGAERTKTAPAISSTHLFGGNGLMFERWTPPETENGKTLLLVAWDPADLDGEAIRSHAERLGPVEVEVLTRDGRFVRRYYYRIAYDYQVTPRP
jgi:dolichol-phosphate mannosyltransferase